MNSIHKDNFIIFIYFVVASQIKSFIFIFIFIFSENFFFYLSLCFVPADKNDKTMTQNESQLNVSSLGIKWRNIQIFRVQSNYKEHNASENFLLITMAR